jgi:hypothetical protein
MTEIDRGKRREKSGLHIRLTNMPWEHARVERKETQESKER